MSRTAFHSSRTLILTVLLASATLATPASAGGSWEPVRVRKLSRTSDTSYVLVVAPLPNDDPYFKGCRLFEVHGSLRRLDGEWPIVRSNAPSKKDHTAALTYLQSFERTGKAVNFGWVGSGFGIINPRLPCIVESRGLQIIDGAVVSYFHEI
jgi:hypothetical protein